MVSEMHALVLGFDAAYTIQQLVTEITGTRPEIEACVDSKTVFEVIANQGRTTEKRLQVDISVLRESYEDFEHSKIGWIPGGSIPADALTKLQHFNPQKNATPLQLLMRTNRL